MKIVKEQPVTKVIGLDSLKEKAHKGMVVCVCDNQATILSEGHNYIGESCVYFKDLKFNDDKSFQTNKDKWWDRFSRDGFLPKSTMEYFFFESLADFCKMALEKGWKF